MKTKKQWWTGVFDDKYLKTYIDIITPEVTEMQVNFIVKKLGLKKGASILDLACGHGRLSIALAKRGYDVTAIDYSKHFIELAKSEAKQQGVTVRFLQQDMRNLQFKNKFDAVINVFTSFGYFDDERDNGLVLEKVRQSLKPKGVFLIDLNNVLRTVMLMGQGGKKDARTGFLTTMRVDKLSNGITLKTKDEWDSVTMRWRMERTWKEKGKNKKYNSEVRLYTLPEIKSMLEQTGLRVIKVWGDFKGSPYDYEARRMIIQAVKK